MQISVRMSYHKHSKRQQTMSEKIVQPNEVIKGQIRELVRGSVEETLNGLLRPG